MNTREILLEELGEKRVAELQDRALLNLVEWAMLQYHEQANKNNNISLVGGSALPNPPSDKEIEAQAEAYTHGFKQPTPQYQGFIAGAKWIRELLY